MAKYTIGADFGTLSGRAVIVEVETGRELASSSQNYPHGVMDCALPDGTLLGVDWALQNPQNHLDVFINTVSSVVKESGISPEDIIGIGVDCTASTLMPATSDGTPLCFLPEYKGNPHAWAKLWKHHAGQDKAAKIEEIARERGESWLELYGGKVSSEWQLPKIWQLLDEAPDIYNTADILIEMADWLVFKLTGVMTRSAGIAGYKGFWSKRNGYPSGEFYAALDPRLENLLDDKFGYPIANLGEKVGGLTPQMAQLLGLNAGIAVAAGNIDAHVTVPSVGIESAGSLLAIMGTSTCHLIVGEAEKPVPGICGVVEDGILPGFFGYEAGQSCVGDGFAWFIDNCIPEHYYVDAKALGKNIHVYLREKAQHMAVGESGLLALDWLNGNRTVLVDFDLSGMVLGMTLQTKPEDIYRALIEATAYGTRKIIETFEQSGVTVEKFYASGGISQKDPMTMQIYSDVTGLPVYIAGSEQGPAVGSAIHGAVAAGRAAGGYDNVIEAGRKMGSLRDTVYRPIAENKAAYDKLYSEYSRLHDYFGRGEGSGGNDVMKRLKQLKIDQIARKNI